MPHRVRLAVAPSHVPQAQQSPNTGSTRPGAGARSHGMLRGCSLQAAEGSPVQGMSLQAGHPCPGAGTVPDCSPLTSPVPCRAGQGPGARKSPGEATAKGSVRSPPSPPRATPLPRLLHQPFPAALLAWGSPAWCPPGDRSLVRGTSSSTPHPPRRPPPAAVNTQTRGFSAPPGARDRFQVRAGLARGRRTGPCAAHGWGLWSCPSQPWHGVSCIPHERQPQAGSLQSRIQPPGMAPGDPLEPRAAGSPLRALLAQLPSPMRLPTMSCPTPVGHRALHTHPMGPAAPGLSQTGAAPNTAGAAEPRAQHGSQLLAQEPQPQLRAGCPVPRPHSPGAGHCSAPHTTPASRSRGSSATAPGRHSRHSRTARRLFHRLRATGRSREQLFPSKMSAACAGQPAPSCRQLPPSLLHAWCPLRERGWHPLRAQPHTLAQCQLQAQPLPTAGRWG